MSGRWQRSQESEDGKPHFLRRVSVSPTPAPALLLRAWSDRFVRALKGGRRTNGRVSAARLSPPRVPRPCLPTAFIKVDATHRWRDCAPDVDVVSACDVSQRTRLRRPSGRHRQLHANADGKGGGRVTTSRASRAHRYSAE
ncbi:hypothetical protein MRX96_022701 [Rhipicephalus microplus]